MDFSFLDGFEVEKKSFTKDQNNPFTVSELLLNIKAKIEPEYKSIWIKGEISNYKKSVNGYQYFTLKDEQATLKAALFKKISLSLSDGLEILCRGKLSVYPPQGSIQLVIEEVLPLGEGALQLKFLELKNRLQKEGLFENALKKKLPLYPRKVGLITAPFGAALQDMLNILSRRAPFLEIVIIPAIVQGRESAQSLIAALNQAKTTLCDVIIIGRGGGSLEDLFSFNDEWLARAIAEFHLPIVSAVGHEVDFTICDFVCDLRAPTPSAAAEIITEHWVKGKSDFFTLNDRLIRLMNRRFLDVSEQVQNLVLRLKSPSARCEEQIQRLDEVMERLFRSIQIVLDRRQQKIDTFKLRLNALSPLAVLSRGYALISKNDHVVSSVKSIHSGDRLMAKFADGEIAIEVLK